jgi:capsular polysaccharide transport system permease protein
MSEDPQMGRGRGRAAVATKPDKAALATEQIAESRPIVAAVSSRARLVEAPPTALSVEIDHEPTIATEVKRGFALPRVKISPLLASFIGCVLVPALAATVYFAFIASDQLAAEARFAVRQVDSDMSGVSSAGPNSSSTGSNGSSTATASFSFTATTQNAYIVTSYIRSRAIVDDLNEKLNLREIFRRPEADFWARLKRNASIDDLVEYWDSMVGTYIDGPSGVVTLMIRAFRPDDAVTLAKAVLEQSEMLVNRISDRARRDAMEMSEKEVRRAYEMTQAALADMHRFRDSAGIIDPVQAANEIGKLLIPLMTEKIRLESDLFVASRNLDDDAPTIRALKGRLETAEKQIADLKAKLTGTAGGNNTVAASLAKFEELELQRQFAEKLYALAQADLDRARLRADRQSVYLTVFVPPSLPEESRYPRRVAFPILIFIGLSVVWSIVGMVLASVEDHRL